MELPGLELVNVRRADAYARVYPFLSPVEVPEGLLDLRRNFPPGRVTTVAPAALLAAREELHPALIDLLLVAAAEIHGSG